MLTRRYRLASFLPQTLWACAAGRLCVCLLSAAAFGGFRSYGNTEDVPLVFLEPEDQRAPVSGATPDAAHAPYSTTCHRAVALEALRHRAALRCTAFRFILLHCIPLRCIACRCIILPIRAAVGVSAARTRGCRCSCGQRAPARMRRTRRVRCAPALPPAPGHSRGGVVHVARRPDRCPRGARPRRIPRAVRAPCACAPTL